VTRRLLVRLLLLQAHAQRGKEAGRAAREVC